jgi:phage terminase small subunit
MPRKPATNAPTARKPARKAEAKAKDAGKAKANASRRAGGNGAPTAVAVEARESGGAHNRIADRLDQADKADRPLSARQAAFVDAYCGAAIGNATQAARLAGYSGNDNALAVRGSELLRIRKVADAVGERTRSRAMAADEWLELVGRIARLSPRDYMSKDPATGRMVYDADRAEATGAVDLIDEFLDTEFGQRVKRPSRMEAIRMIGQNLALLIERQEVKQVTDTESLRQQVLSKLLGPVNEGPPSGADTGSPTGQGQEGR